ncbi:Na+/H+ antiporter subunit D [Elioraea tepida]|uniref:Na+/H+ antiporter subunit D n=1 Tax=Elioraea tepida TaxID=2843330 RepID=A0A975U2A9_9PROT|nr:Na+/H+ antiporter subunit D [Elioraea tepida]QXM23811.1 Na+/H+ antiporter subunit D [Elioraea tepida]
MNGWYAALAALLPLAAAATTLIAHNRPRLQTALSLGFAAALLVDSALLFAAVWRDGIVVVQASGWAAPFGITLAVDTLGAVMTLIAAITGLACLAYATAEISEEDRRAFFHPLSHVLLAGVCGAFVTGDLFNLYVWFEVLLIASFGLLVIGGSKAQTDGAVKYLALNLVATSLFLLATGLIYGLTGTLNMADLALAVPRIENVGVLNAAAMMLLAAFGMKAAVFPLFFWLPASYHTPLVSVSAVFAGLLTKVGVYALIRVVTLIFTHDPAWTNTLLLWTSGLTMLTGVLGAAAQNEWRRILSFHIVSQIGYMVMGLALGTRLGLVGAVFYLVHHIVVKANLFLIAGVARHLVGSMELKRSGGLYVAAPWLAILFFIPAFSLAGFPPLSGFWAKYIVIKAALDERGFWIAAAALVTGLLTIYSMTKIWGEAFWKPHPDGAVAATEAPRAMVAPIAALAACTVVIGLFAQPFLAVAERAAAELTEPARYITAVLGARS